MKKLNFWSTLMLVVMVLPLMVSCSGDDSNDGGGGSVSYTEAEIVELLTGKWEVYGDLKVEFYDTKEVLTDNYKGTLELTSAKSVKFVITEGTPQEYKYDGSTYKLYFEKVFVDDYHKYTVLKKNGKSYISFGSSYSFEIVSLTKTTFKMILNEEVYNSNDKSKAVGHYYMTIVSK